MFTNLNTDPNKRPRLLGELGDLSHAKVSSGECKYSKGTEIFGQAEPADYIYQVIEGAVHEMTRFIYALKEIRACLEAELLTDVQQRLALLSRGMGNHNGHHVLHQPTFPRS